MPAAKGTTAYLKSPNTPIGKGRPPGARNKRTKLVHSKAMIIVQESGLLPMLVMHEKMVHQVNRSADLLDRLERGYIRTEKLLDRLEENEEEVDKTDMERALKNVRDGVDTLIEMIHSDDRAFKYAAELAPYIHPKLTAIAIKQMREDGDEQTRTSRLQINFVDPMPVTDKVIEGEVSEAA